MDARGSKTEARTESPRKSDGKAVRVTTSDSATKVVSIKKEGDRRRSREVAVTELRAATEFQSRNFKQGKIERDRSAEALDSTGMWLGTSSGD